MHVILLLFWLGQQAAGEPRAATATATPEQALIEEIAHSGRTVAAGEPAGARVALRKEVPPGAPPLLSFRYYEGKQHHRFGDVDLMLDDAGH